jgi:putative Holliday junction resolvase
VSEEEGRSGRALGLDLGDVRIGVAISDPQRRVAVPLGFVRTGAPADLKAIAKIVHENDVSLVVVGDPIQLSGKRGDRSNKAKGFADALFSMLGIPVELEDERLSTVEAERSLLSAGVRGRERREVVDRSAATVILQSFLDRNRSG